MSEIERLFKEIAAYPDTEPIGIALHYNSSAFELGYTVARAGDPAIKVKTFIYSLLTYCVMNFGSGIDLDKIKKEIFG